MADNVPVSDVLCEAMEYLSKLGSKLRSQSDVLKEKRIRRDKLKNNHAVKKAAKKVLLICELSKKSLENVESGVKNILNLVDASQRRAGSVGGKSTPRESRDSDRKYSDKKKEVYFIEYKSRKLRIASKISLKHYTSVKVLTSNMPMSMHDKYPVYHNCKLYRLRKKLGDKATHRLKEINDKHESDSNRDKENNFKERSKDSENKYDSESRSGSQDRLETKAFKKYFAPEKDVEDPKSQKKSYNSESEIETVDTDKDEEEIEREQKKHQKTKNRKNNKDKIDEDEMEREQKRHQRTKDRKKDKEKEKNQKEDSPHKETINNISVIDLSSDEEEINDSGPTPRKKGVISDSDESDNKDDVPKSNLKSTPDSEVQVNDSGKKDKSEESSPESKPGIKLVSLSKLLKPDVLVKVAGETIKAIRTKEHKENRKNPIIKKIDLCKDEDEAFWATKREEVKGFKAKEFKINVTKLPTKFSEEFLVKLSLKKITQNNSVVFELEKESLNKLEKAETQLDEVSDKTVQESVVPPDMNVIKNALLIDSDSENSIDTPANNLVKESENAKNKLLDDSDQENNEDNTGNNEVVNETDVQSKDKEHTQEPKKNIEKDQENTEINDHEMQPEVREKTPESESVPEKNLTDVALAKSSLLENSTPNTPQKPKEKERRKSMSVTPSKRKLIKESIQAKKVLLTHSSSSDEDDNKMKDIRSELLKGSSDEDATPKKVSNRRKLSSSDSEIDELLDRVKKKRKIRRTKGSGSDKDESGSDKEITNGQKNQSNENDDEVKDNSDKVADEDDSKTEDSGDKTADSHNNEDLPKDSDTKANSDQDDAADNQSNSSEKMGRTRETPSSSSKSEGQDDKEIDGLTNMKTLTRSSRSRGAPKSQESNSKTKSKPVKKSMFSDAGEGLLEATLSSDEVSANSSAGEEEEDLPPVSMTTLNGSQGIEHLAKDDLLGSDSDGSHEDAQDNGDASENDNKKDDSDSDTVKAPRRKAHTISSDSEGGPRRKANDKDSDFEDSDADSEPTKAKRKKRQKKGSDDDSAGSGNEGKKKRRRIKSVNDSDASGSDSENEGKKHGRKNIRKVMGKNQLEEATKKAAREERERMARIAERQKTYNNVQFDESGKPDEVVLDRVVLDFDPETKEPLIQVDQGLVKKLKPHQANGIKFMWDACFESVKRIKKDRGSGCILAHCMGLGKTLQVVSLTHTLLTHSSLTSVQRVLVVCPLSTVLNWVNEFRMWLEFADNEPDVDVYELSRYKQNSERAYQLSQWFKHGGVCVLGYEMFRNLSADNPKKFKKKMLKQFQESLVDPGPDMVVCDEGHLLKNEKTSLSQSMNRVRTRRRIVLTGTPLQNNLKEYYCMVQFVKPNLLGKYNEYLNRFVNPITNGQYTDSTEYDIKIMKRRSHVLHKMLDGAVQRRDYGVLAPFLPPKHEYVLFITLTDVQIKLYNHYLENYSRRPMAGKTSGFLFPDFQSLQRIWTHPLVLKYNSERYEIMQQKKRDKEEEDSEGSLVDFIDDDSTPDESSSEDSSDYMSDVSDDSRKKSKKKKASKKSKKDSRANNKRTTRANPELDDDMENLPELPAEVKNDNPTEWWMPLVTDDELEDLRHSHKLVLLFEILRQCEAIGDKLLVFSQSLYSLDLIEHFLGKVDEATQDGRVDDKLGGHVGSWSPGIDYFRLDGSTSCENRSIWCKNFNREDNPRARLFLISTRAGGLGINLVAANRVVIFDVSWNPSHDVQSIFRVYRFGQKKPCYVYRFLAMGTMEEKIYERQVTKQAISKRVIDEQQIDRHYKENDLAELYTFEPRPPAPRPVPLVPKDRFFAEMLKDHEDLIYKFHEHDSLLENKEEETLSEEERKAAWEDFENEKNRPPPQPFANWPMHNGMMPNLLAAQQQQLAFAALGAVLRKDMPGLSEDQIRGMIPLIYGANPALMQKLNDMYKYAAPQPGMVNPAMMNPGVMGPGGGGGGMGAGSGAVGGVGGTSSSLQYSPPWQRQQQQQQQMRLQQLMQHQAMGGQPMGAKLYAGGLGSRDPVAMALQQQRARDLMVGERGRPRGRPPARPTGDVVNLDSD